jgi:uncharacterized protein (DUF2267 family)
MSMTGLEVFDSTVQKTNMWIKDVMEALGWEDRHKAYEGLKVTLWALRDRLTVVEAAHLAAQLPLLVRGFYYESWSPAHTPVKARHKVDFLAPVREHFKNDPSVNTEELARAVFAVLAKHVTAGEIEDIRRMLPDPLKTLWPVERSEV